jgi:hypothetical protein
MSMADTFAPALAEYRNRVLAKIWDHLGPEKGRINMRFEKGPSL